MKKLLAASLGLLLALGVAGTVAAQVGIEGHGLYTFEYDDDDVNTIEEFGGGAGLTWRICPYLRLDVSADYYKPKSRCAITGEREKIRLVPVTAGLAVGSQIWEGFSLYFGGGAGYSFNHISESDMEAKDCYLWFAYGTLEYFLSCNLALQAQYRYSWIRPDLKYKPADLLAKDVNFDHMEARLGLALYF